MTLEELLDVVREVEVTDPIDFGYLPIDEDGLFFLTANAIVEMYYRSQPEDREIVMLASMVKLAVENTVLQMKLNGVT